MLKKFKQHAEKQSPCNLKILSINGEGQYIFIKFKEFQRNGGIEHEVTTPYTPFNANPFYFD